MTAIYTPTEVLVATRCASCGVWFGVTEFFDEKRRATGKTFYCPNGHSLSFRETDLEKARKERDQAWRVAKSRLDLLHQEERSHAATRGHLTRTKRRVANGVCPCCGRTFKQLARHMTAKHPEYVEGSPT